MQQLDKKTSSTFNIGINARMIKEVLKGPIDAEEVDLIEISIGDSGVLKKEIDYKLLEEFRSLSNKFSIHGPYTNDDYFGNTVNWGVLSKRNFEVMEKVFTIADYLDAQYIVLHGDRADGDYREAFLNVIANLKQLAKMAADHSLTLLLENLHKEKRGDRIGVLPHEILQVLETVDEENLKFCFDVGHGNLSANQYRFELTDFVVKLAPYLSHMHIHDNMGIPEVVDERFGDQHLPVGMGKIDYNKIFSAIQGLNVKNLVLELRPQNDKEAVLKSIALLNDARN
ncbi:MAG: sugar phosphate isomerase/epimerase [Candidatus Bathyarchaeota archaeon]|nr:sugar phosphate isomerase/epimerase [Candidatus Bathyarchaeota archaeon]